MRDFSARAPFHCGKNAPRKFGASKTTGSADRAKSVFAFCKLSCGVTRQRKSPAKAGLLHKRVV
jgi:hypothetical protein